MFGALNSPGIATNTYIPPISAPSDQKPKFGSSLFSPSALTKPPALATAYPLPRNSRFADLKIIVGDEKLSYDVHKVVVCARSPVIRKAIEGDFMEAKEGCYNITSFPSEIVNVMIDFMYSGFLTPIIDLSIYQALLLDFGDSNPLKDNTKRLFIYLELNSIADFYDVANLRENANQKIEKLLQDNWREIQPLFGAFVERVYGKTSDKDLQSLIITYSVSHIQDLKTEFASFAELDIPKEFFAIVLCRSLGVKP